MTVSTNAKVTTPLDADVDNEPLQIEETGAPWLPPMIGHPFIPIGPEDKIKAIDAVRKGNGSGSQSTPLSIREQAQEHLTAALRLMFPENTWDDSVEQTARRVLGYWQEHVPTPDIDFTFTTFHKQAKQLIFVGDIEFTSICAHHLLPFTGKAHIGYIPHKVQVGLSKIPRLVEFWARRPQVQENLTAQILNDLKARLDTSDVIVVIEARHTCVSSRGVRNHNGLMRTSLPSGVFFSSPPARDEFFRLLSRTGV